VLSHMIVARSALRIQKVDITLVAENRCARRVCVRQTAHDIRNGIDLAWRRVRGLREDLRSSMSQTSPAIIRGSRLKV